MLRKVAKIIGKYFLLIMVGIPCLLLIAIGVTMPFPATEYTTFQKQATRALLKFCEDHAYGDTDIAVIRESLAALEREDIKTAVKCFQSIHFGPDGFSDWMPAPAFPHEDDEYASGVFEALVERWARLMSLSIPNR